MISSSLSLETPFCRSKNLTESKHSSTQWMFIVILLHWYQRLPSSSSPGRENKIFISAQRSIKLESLVRLRRLKSLKTRLNVFLNVFWEGDCLSRQVVEWDQLGVGREGVLYRFAPTRAGGSVFCSVCVCLLSVNSLGWKRKFLSRFCIAWENKITKNDERSEGGWQKHETYLLENKRSW